MPAYARLFLLIGINSTASGKKKKRRKSVVEPLMVLENKVVSSCWVLASGFFAWHMGVSNNIYIYIYVKDFEF